eukprot:s1551_g25.t1
MFTVVEWNHGTPTASRDLMVTETNLETGRPREHQVEFFFFKLVGDWNMAQRMGNYWRQHYGLDTYPVDAPSTPPSTPTVPTDALDTPMAVAVQLIREMRNLPLAGSIEEYNNQLLALVGGSGISPRLSSVQLETLAAGSAHWDLELADEVRQRPLGSGQLHGHSTGRAGGDGVGLAIDFREKVWSLIQEEIPCDWDVLSLSTSCPAGRCISPHLARIGPYPERENQRCDKTVSGGFGGILYRSAAVAEFRKRWMEVAFDANHPSCLNLDASLKALSDEVAFYAVPAVQTPRILSC